MSCCSGSIRRSSALLASQPMGDMWVQYFVAPSDVNCSILASCKPMSSSCCFTCSAAWWNIVEGWVGGGWLSFATCSLAFSPESSSLTSFLSSGFMVERLGSTAYLWFYVEGVLSRFGGKEG